MRRWKWVFAGVAIAGLSSATLVHYSLSQTVALVEFEGADEIFLNGKRQTGKRVALSGLGPKRLAARWGDDIRRFVYSPGFTDENAIWVTVPRQGKPDLHYRDIDIREVSQF